MDDWLPAYTLTDGSGAQVSSGRLVDCPDLARPEKFSGIDTVAVSSFDITSTLQDRRTVGVVAGGEQLYATDTATYVTTTEWNRDDSTPTTSLHKFLTAPSGATAYRGSGEVPGNLLNQYSMSEFDGVLRVATTVSGRRGWVNSRMVNEGVVTTLREQDGTLKQIGQVDGLGREDNESIRAVRFIGNKGYVVTFRQTDPLYVLDLRDPAAPKVTGELKIPGYSGYLHPIGTDLLLGVGQSGHGQDPVLAVQRQRPRVTPADRHPGLRLGKRRRRVRPEGVPLLGAAQSGDGPDHLLRPRQGQLQRSRRAARRRARPGRGRADHPARIGRARRFVRWSSATTSMCCPRAPCSPTASTATAWSTG